MLLYCIRAFHFVLIDFFVVVVFDFQKKLLSFSKNEQRQKQKPLKSTMDQHRLFIFSSIFLLHGVIYIHQIFSAM